MAKQPRVADPRIEWTEGEFRVLLLLQGGMIDVKWRPGTTTVVRIRESRYANLEPWLETPLNGYSFFCLKPNTKNEIQVTHKNEAAEGPPNKLRCKTRSNGNVGKIIRFPRK